jgi:hypothetical protein
LPADLENAFGGHDGADSVAAEVLSSGVAAAVAKEARHGVYRADFELVAEHVTGRVPPAATNIAIVPQHVRIPCVLVPTKSSRPLGILSWLSLHAQYVDH